MPAFNRVPRNNQLRAWFCLDTKAFFMLFRLCSVLLLVVLGFVQVVGQVSATIRGSVRDAKTNEPLIGATVLIQGTDLGTATDLDGRFEISGVPPQTYNIEATYVGYGPKVRFNVIIRSEGNLDLDFLLEPQASTLGEVVVKPNPFEKSASTPLSIQALSQEEIAAYPGGNNDIAKVVQTLPGISGSVGGFRNDVIIRGGAPNENVYFLDGIEIPNINHFATQGSAGGPVGLLNVSFFEGVTLSASAFGAQYDNTLSGVLQFDQRTGNSREFAGNIRVSSSEAALTLEGPLLKGDRESAKTTYLVSARRSYLQLLFKAIGLPFLPDYWDFQYKINHEIDDYNSIYLTGVGSIDNFSINELEEFDPEQQAQQDQVPVIQQRTQASGLSWRRRFKDNSGLMTTTLSFNTLANDFLRYSDNINQKGLFFRNDSRETEFRLRYNLTQFIGPWTTSFGGSLIRGDYENSTQDVVNNLTFTSALQIWRYGFYAQANRRLANERLGLSLGVRWDGNDFTAEGGGVLQTFSPRLALSYRLDPEGEWSVNASLGRYYKILPYTSLGFQDDAGIFVNQNSDYIRSDHLVGGLEYLVSSSARITVEGFYKKYSNYPVSLRDGISLANKGGGFEVLGSEPIVSEGEGRSYGVEFLFQQKFTGRLYAIGALTVYRSEFTGLDGEFFPAVWDNQVLVSLLAGYQLGRNWEISGRYRYLGRAPYVPVDQEATLAAYPAILLDYDQFGTVRLDAFQQLDIRVDKKWNFKRFSLDVFLDIQNVLAQNQPQEPQFGLDRTETGEVVEPQQLVEVTNLSEGSVLPSIGIVLNF